MRRWFPSWVQALLPPRTRPEPSLLIVGSTESGKSDGKLVDLVRSAGRGDCAVVRTPPGGRLHRSPGGA